MTSATYGDISPAVAAYAVVHMLGQQRMVRPIEVPCRYCNAEPGEHCTKLRGGKRITRGYTHRDRRYDAKLATEAVNALDRR